MDREWPEGALTTVVFTDVERSTELVTEHGDEAARRLLRQHEETVRAQCAEHGGREMKSLGDGFMLAFTSPRAAIACAVGIQRGLGRARLQSANGHVRVRIGINIGEVLHEDGDIFGEAVNAAARIAAKAEGGEVLVSDVVRQLVGTVPGVSFADRGRFRLKGFPERWRLHRVVWEEDDDGAAVPAGAPARAPMVGRDRERQELAEAMARAAAGQGELVLIGGEPGIGKTRLCEELAREARRSGRLALAGRCYDSEAALPYQPFAEIIEAAIERVPRDLLRTALGDAGGDVATVVPELRRIFPDLPPPLDLPAEMERRHLFTAMRDFVGRAAAQAPLLLVLDDLHWADASTLLLLQHLAERLATMPALVIGTYRDVELDTTRPFAASLDSLVRRRLARRVTLRRLQREHTAAVLAGLSGSTPPPPVVDAIVAETEGNPFFVEEVFRHFAEEGRLLDAEGRWRSAVSIGELEVPQSVRLVIGRRLDRLSEVARRVLAGAAVIGRSFAYDLLEEVVSDVDADVLLDSVDEAERAALLTSTTHGRVVTFSFAHELMRQTLLSSLSAPRRQRLHLRIAGVLEARSDADPAEVAHHLYESGGAADAVRTVDWLLRAAQRDVQAAAYEDALRLVDRAGELADDVDDVHRAALLAVRGRALLGSGHREEGMEAWTQALDMLERAGDHERHLALCTDLVFQLNWSGRQLDAILMCARGLAMAESAPRHDPRLASMLGWSAMGFSYMGNYEIGAEQGRKALEDAAAAHDPTVERDARYALAYHHFFWLEGRQCRAMLAPVIAAHRAAGNAWQLAEALAMDALASIFEARVDEAAALAGEAQQLAVRLGQSAAETVALRSLGLVEMIGGRLDECARHVRRNTELAQAIGWLWAFDAYVLEAIVAMWRGDWDGAGRLLDRAAAEETPGPFSHTPWGYRVLLEGLRGNRDAVLAIADENSGLAGPPDQPILLGLSVAMSCLAEALALVGADQRAADLYPYVARWPQRGALLRGYDERSAHAIAGTVAAAGGDWHLAEEHFTAALQLAESMPYPREMADIRRSWAGMLLRRRATGDRERARLMLGEAVDGYRALRAPGFEALAQAMLRSA